MSTIKIFMILTYLLIYGWLIYFLYNDYSEDWKLKYKKMFIFFIIESTLIVCIFIFKCLYL